MAAAHREEGSAGGQPGSTGARRSPRRILAILATVVVLAAVGCGSSGRSGSDGGDGSPDTTTDVTTASFGTLESPCGPGTATGATQQGVTDTSITIGYGDDAGFPQSPGLDHELADAVEAMIGWCNEQGGINGREVVGDYHDAKVTDVNTAMTEACASDFMLVGEGWSLDSLQESTRLGCGLAAVPGFAASPAFAHGELVVQAVPNPVDFASVEIAAAMQEQFPEQIKKASVMFGNYASTIDPKDKVLASYPAFGFEFLDCPQEYNIAGETDWKPFVQRLKDCGAETVYFVGSPYPFFENVLDAASQLDYSPIWITDANFYDEAFAQWNVSGLADSTYVRSTFTPLEEASSDPRDPAVRRHREGRRRGREPARGAGHLGFPPLGDGRPVMWLRAHQRLCDELPQRCPQLDRRRAARRDRPGCEHADRLRPRAQARRNQLRSRPPRRGRRLRLRSQLRRACERPRRRPGGS